MSRPESGALQAAARAEHLRRYLEIYFPIRLSEVERPFEWRGQYRDPKVAR